MDNDKLFALMVDLAAALMAAVTVGKINEADIINQDGVKEEIGSLLDRAEAAMVERESFAPDAQGDDTAAFKNFHRLLCERFNYSHDPIDWRRDQISLIEHIAQGAATDEKSNARGEPEAIYLQLHDPDEIDASEAADYRSVGTWCWHRVHGNDVRYIREDLAQGAAVTDIDYSVLHQFAYENKCSYNKLCAAVKKSLLSAKQVNEKLSHSLTPKE